MFYSTQILAKKGPLGTIWIAAHLERRLKRHQVFETSITLSVDSIINPEAPLALRLSGQLLLGVVRIYSRKVGYLFQDCNDALLKIKSAFTQHGLVDMPEEQATANPAAITLPDNYDNLQIFTDPAAGSITLTYEHGENDLADDLAFTVRDDSIQLDADYNALTYDGTPAQDEVFDKGVELDLENAGYVSDGEDEVERLRSAEDGLPEAQTPDVGAALLESADLGGGYENDDAGGFPEEEEIGAVEEGSMADFATPGIPGGQQTPGMGGTPGIPGSETPGIELGVVGDTPGADAEVAGGQSEGEEAAQADVDEVPELGVGGVVSADASLGDEKTVVAHKRAAKRAEAEVDDGNEGRCRMELPGAAIRALLADRSPLLVNRGLRGGLRQLCNPKVEKKRKQMHVQSVLMQPAVPGPVSGTLLEMWDGANEVARGVRSAALAADRQEVARSRAAKKQAVEEEEVEAADIGERDGEVGAKKARVEDAVEEHDAREEVLRTEDGEEHEAEQFEEDGGFDGDGRMQMFEEVEEVAGAEEGEEAAAAVEEAVEVLEEDDDEEDDLPPAAELFQSGDQEQEAQGGSTDAAATTFTANTRAVLKHVRGLAERRMACEGNTKSVKGDIVGLKRLVAGKKRLDASRWFFEMLVLKSKDYVELEQKEPYGDIKIRGGAKLLSAR